MDVLFIFTSYIMYFVIDLSTYPDTYLEVSTAMKRGYIICSVFLFDTITHCTSSPAVMLV